MKRSRFILILICTGITLSGCTSSDSGSLDRACGLVQEAYSIDSQPLPTDLSAIELMRLASEEFKTLAESDSAYLEYAEITGGKASGNYLNADSLRSLCQVQ
jgi:hypothetical protein